MTTLKPDTPVETFIDMPPERIAGWFEARGWKLPDKLGGLLGKLASPGQWVICRSGGPAAGQEPPKEPDRAETASPPQGPNPPDEPAPPEGGGNGPVAPPDPGAAKFDGPKFKTVDEVKTALAERCSREAVLAFANRNIDTPEFHQNRLDAAQKPTVFYALERTLAKLREPWLRFYDMTHPSREMLASRCFDHELERARELAAEIGPPLVALGHDGPEALLPDGYGKVVG
jgi:hypothetical protein